MASNMVILTGRMPNILHSSRRMATNNMGSLRSIRRSTSSSTLRRIRKCIVGIRNSRSNRSKGNPRSSYRDRRVSSTCLCPSTSKHTRLSNSTSSDHISSHITSSHSTSSRLSSSNCRLCSSHSTDKFHNRSLTHAHNHSHNLGCNRRLWFRSERPTPCHTPRCLVHRRRART